MLEKRYSPQQIEKAMERLLFDCKFQPTIADISMAAEAVIMAEKPQQATISEAWAIIDREVRKCGMDERPNLEKPEIVAAVNAYGWANLVNARGHDYDYAKAVILAKYKDIIEAKAEDRRNGLVLTSGNNQSKKIDSAVKGLIKSW